MAFIFLVSTCSLSCFCVVKLQVVVVVLLLIVRVGHDAAFGDLVVMLSHFTVCCIRLMVGCAHPIEEAVWPAPILQSVERTSRPSATCV